MIAAWEDAIKRGDVPIVLELLGRGLDADARDCYGQTALMLAAHAGHREVVETLIAHGADLNITAKFGLSALMLALIAGLWRKLGSISHCGEQVLRDSLTRQPLILLWSAAWWRCPRN